MNDREEQRRPDTDDAGLSGLFEDLEQQAAGIHLAERDAELADRARGEYASVSFGSRVHASLGREVALTLMGGEVVEGTMVQAGADWCQLVPAGRQGDWLIRLAAVVSASGLSPRAVPEAARPALARLTFGSALHRMAEESPELVLHLVWSGRTRVRVVRIGADFVESAATAGGTSSTTTVVPFTGIAAARTG